MDGRDYQIKMKENHSCKLCDLSTTCNPKSICLNGESKGDGKKPLMIFLDAPGIVEDKRSKSFVSDGADLLRWLMARMSVRMEHVVFDYVLKCYPKPNPLFGKKPHRMSFIQACSVYRIATLQLYRPKAVVVMGATACEAFLGSNKVSDFEGTTWTPEEPKIRELIDCVWVTYAPAYALQSPAECVTLYRTLFSAAQKAGLRPKLNQALKHYDFGF